MQAINPAKDPASVVYKRCTIDLTSRKVTLADLPCRNLEDVLGGIGRSFQFLAERRITDPFSPENPLIVNTGLLTGTNVMTGLRVYFSSYSPIKHSSKGLPAAMWSASSGNFGSKLKWTGIDEVIFESRSEQPVYAVFSEGESGPQVELKPANHLLGLSTHEKIMRLYEEYTDGHFAAIGTAGENYSTVAYGSVAVSTDNELKSNEDKCRFAGRGGMGSIMGYKNLIALVARGKQKLGPITPEMREVNRDVIKNGGSARFQPVSQGGGGGTWANLDFLHAFYAAPELNFRPGGTANTERLLRESVEKDLPIRTEACFRCGIRCHNNVFEKKSDGSTGEFIAKFDFEPLNLFGSNLGIYNPWQVAQLIKLCDNFGMDSISLGTTLAYVLDYNGRHPGAPILNGATFGDFDLVKELIIQTGNGNLPDVGGGVKRLSEKTGETAYAMHVKGLELPAYLPDNNPGYTFAIAGGHMSMGTHMLLAKEGKTGLEDWVNAITKTAFLHVGYDMIGLCKFVGVGMNHDLIVRSIKHATGLEVESDDLVAAVRRAFLRGVALELRQGYTDELDYTLPSQIFDNPNPNVKLPAFITREFFAELKKRVWEVFTPELEGLLPES